MSSTIFPKTDRDTYLVLLLFYLKQVQVSHRSLRAIVLPSPTLTSFERVHLQNIAFVCACCEALEQMAWFWSWIIAGVFSEDLCFSKLSHQTVASSWLLLPGNPRTPYRYACIYSFYWSPRGVEGVLMEYLPSMSALCPYNHLQLHVKKGFTGNK